jgi:hypothetical protein
MQKIQEGPWSQTERNGRKLQIVQTNKVKADSAEIVEILGDGNLAINTHNHIIFQ